MGYKDVLISARSSPVGNPRGLMADMPLSTAKEAPYLGCGLEMARSVTSMPAANQSSPPVIDWTILRVSALSLLLRRGFCQASDSSERVVDEPTLEPPGPLPGARCARRTGNRDAWRVGTDRIKPFGSNEFDGGDAVGVRTSFTPGPVQGRDPCAGGADARKRAELAPRFDRRTARRRDTR
jgi:hypothetical protein